MQIPLRIITKNQRNLEQIKKKKIELEIEEKQIRIIANSLPF